MLHVRVCDYVCKIQYDKRVYRAVKSRQCGQLSLASATRNEIQ